MLSKLFTSFQNNVKMRKEKDGFPVKFSTGPLNETESFIAIDVET